MIETILTAMLLFIVWSFATIGLIIIFAPVILLALCFVTFYKLMGDNK